ncbi:MAG: twitching motility protein PilT [Candidatus Binatia bacterium]|nr:MAG: twitching motility protein PilT [Candidatus Binatia bacterium]
MSFDEILEAALERAATDVILKGGRPPAFRIANQLLAQTELGVLSPRDVEDIVDELFDEYRKKRFLAELHADFAHETPRGRFRVNVFRQRGQLALAVRLISPTIRTCAQLHLPPVVERLAEERRGLVLVTGATGSGKSTTLAAMIDHINRTRAAHVITIEDPIEYLHEDKKSFVEQREVGYDAVDFASALKAALRQNPDVILVGEMRDLETIRTALLAAETGHLVLSTLHTTDAPQTITRTISTFPEAQRDEVRLVLASVVKGIVSQRLVPRADGQGLVPAVEVLVASERTREYIADRDKTRALRDVIAQGHESYGMQTFDQSLMALYRAGLVSYEEALAHATNPSDFALRASGIASSDGHWRGFDDREEKVEIERF